MTVYMLKRGQYTCMIYRDSLEGGPAGRVEVAVEFSNGHGIGDIALVVLEEEGDVFEIALLRFQKTKTFTYRMKVFLKFVFLGNDHKNDRIGVVEDTGAMIGVEGAVGYGGEMEVLSADMHLHRDDSVELVALRGKIAATGGR
jgi:hypothetical protein